MPISEIGHAAMEEMYAKETWTDAFGTFSFRHLLWQKPRRVGQQEKEAARPDGGARRLCLV